MKDALRRGDLAGGLQLIASGSRDNYREMLSALTVPLSQIDDVLKDVTLERFDEDRAEYEMLRIDNGVLMSHFVVFVRDADGIWRVKFF